MFLDISKEGMQSLALDLHYSSFKIEERIRNSFATQEAIDVKPLALAKE